jgi:hypothetical protein
LNRIAVRTRATHAAKSYTVAWHVPTKVATPLKFCVVAFDPSGNASPKSCAPITLALR